MRKPLQCCKVYQTELFDDPLAAIAQAHYEIKRYMKKGTEPSIIVFELQYDFDADLHFVTYVLEDVDGE